MKRCIQIVFIILIAACDSKIQACDQYLTAYNSCGDEFFEGNITWRAGYLETCMNDINGGLTPVDMKTQEYRCRQEVYESADCSTEEGWNQALDDANGC